MIFIVKNKDGRSQYVFADTPKQARSRAIINGRGKKSDLDVDKAGCQCSEHWQNFQNCSIDESYAARNAVAFVRGEPWCAVCIATISKPLEERVADLERRVLRLEENL